MSANTKDRNGQLHPQIVGNWSTISALVVNSSSVATAAFAAATTRTRVAVGAGDTGVYAAIGTEPTATTSGILFPAGGVYWVAVSGGQKLAFIKAGTASIRVTVTEIV